MFNRVIVPLDGTVLAEAILPLTSQLAQKLRAEVVLIHVIEGDETQSVHGQRHLTSAEEAAAYLEQAKQRFLPPSVVVRTHIHETGVRDVAQSIVAHAEDLGGDLVAICTHGRSGPARFLFGSIAQQVLIRGRIPVLVLYPHNLEKPMEPHCTRILVALDGNPEHEAGFHVALDLAQSCSASVRLVMAVHTLSTLPGERAATAIRLPGTANALLAMNQESGLSYLNALTHSTRDSAVTTSSEVRRGDPARVILKAARGAGSDLIVMATHGKSCMSSFWDDSLPPKVARRAHIPLLLVPVPVGER
jgi:nucleotide-binding universal stress UspA family protein